MLLSGVALSDARSGSACSGMRANVLLSKDAQRVFATVLCESRSRCLLAHDNNTLRARTHLSQSVSLFLLLLRARILTWHIIARARAHAHPHVTARPLLYSQQRPWLDARRAVLAPVASPVAK